MRGESTAPRGARPVGSDSRCEIELELPREAASEALRAAVEAWEGEWTELAPDRGRLALPVVFGLRRGFERGTLEIVRLGDERSRLVWTLEESQLHLHRGAVAILLFAALPLLAAVVSPFHPPLFAIVPFAAVTGLLAWWVVISRLRTRGPHEFLESLVRPPIAPDSGPKSGTTS